MVSPRRSHGAARAGGLAVILLCAALALPAPPVMAQAFSRADTDQDGFVSFEEARRVMRTLTPNHFRRCDRDGTGLLDRGQYACLQNLYQTLNFGRR